METAKRRRGAFFAAATKLIWSMSRSHFSFVVMTAERIESPPMSDPVSEEQLTDWERLADGAIEGPWESVYDDDMAEVSIRIEGESRGFYTEICQTSQWPEDEDRSPTAEFLVAARTAVPALIAEVRRLSSLAENAERSIAGLQAENEKLKRELRIAKAVDFGE